MLPRCRCVRVPAVFALTTSVALVLGGGSAAGAPNRPPTNRPLNAYDTAAVERARAGAFKKLRSPECSRVLADFRDAAGHPLDENLAPWGVGPAEYLLLIAFRDGRDMPGCRTGAVEMVTATGLPAVFVCPARKVLNSRFAQVGDPSLAEAMIIHEMLHTLGLGENPPTTFEITEKVRERCR